MTTTLLLITAGGLLLTATAISAYLYRTLRAERRHLEKVCVVLSDDLKENEHRFRCFYDNAFEGLAITRDQIILDCNQQLATMFGYTPKELIGQPVTMLVLPDDHDKVTQAMKKNVTIPYQHRSVSKTGAIGMVEVCGQVASYKGQPVRVTAVHDVTDKQNAISLLAKIQAHEHQAGKMEAIGNFAAGIAHDFNNILSPIVGHAGVLLMEMPDGEQKKSVQSIIKAADLASQLIHRIQSFAKVDYLQTLHPVDVSTVITEAVAFLRSISPATVAIELYMQSQLYTILATEITIKQMLMNLCKNATQAMDADTGQITITAENYKCKETTARQPAGAYLRLIVADTGCGMDAATLKRALDPYFTTKQTGKNSGLGLTIVHGIVESYEAVMRIASTQHKGTTITIDIPAATERQIAAAAQVSGDPDDISPVLLGTGQRILFVDDESYVVDVIKKILVSLNYTVDGFDSSLDAWDSFRADPARYAAVISDVTMPSMTGIQLIQNIKSLNPAVKTVLCSGLGSNYKHESAMAASDIDAYITKPAGREKFARILTDLLTTK